MFVADLTDFLPGVMGCRSAHVPDRGRPGATTPTASALCGITPSEWMPATATKPSANQGMVTRASSEGILLLAAGALVAPFEQRVTLPGGLRLWSARPMKPGSAVQRAARFLQIAGARVSGESGL